MKLDLKTELNKNIRKILEIYQKLGVMKKSVKTDVYSVDLRGWLSTRLRFSTGRRRQVENLSLAVGNLSLVDVHLENLSLVNVDHFKTSGGWCPQLTFVDGWPLADFFITSQKSHL